MYNLVDRKWKLFFLPCYLFVSVALLWLSSCSQSTFSASTLSGQLIIVGSTALQPLTTTVAPIFEQEHPQVHITVSGG